MFRFALLLIAIAVARIVSTYWLLNHTMDEPMHIACGLEWLARHNYTFELQHPPLSRIAVAVGPWLLGSPVLEKATLSSTNPDVLYKTTSYYWTLATARAGELPFFILAALVVWWWARRLHGEVAALLAVLLFTTLPPVLAHAGLATTDMALTGTFAAALYLFVRWLEEPSPRHTVLLGLAVAAGVLSKFTFVLFFPICAVVVLLIKLPRPRAIGRRMIATAIAGAISFFVVWAVFFFHITPVKTNEGPGGIIETLPRKVQKIITRQPIRYVPAGEVYLGMVDAHRHNYYGHVSYLFGEKSSSGWWYFFPVVLAYKTPLAFLLLVLLPCIWLVRAPRDHWIPLACAMAILISVLPSRINLGIRHILPMYPLLAIPAGFAAAKLIQAGSRAPRVIGVLLVGWQLIASGLSHPDYIAYFNEMALGKPEQIRVDSDLDWGQGIERLSRRLRQLGIKDSVGTAFFGSVDPRIHGLFWHRISPWKPSEGWVAVTATELKLSDEKPPDGSQMKPWSWLDGVAPVERIGGGAVLLYYIKSDSRAAAP